MKVLFNALPFQRGTDPQLAALAYIEALQGLSAQAITEGVRKFLRGECEGVSTKFVPTPPELARIIRTAVVPSRIPEKQIAARPEPTLAERGRMKLKMSLFSFAMTGPGARKVEEANRAGFEASIALAQEWGVPIPEETWAAFKMDGAEQEWQRQRNIAWHRIENSPPPFMRNRRAA